MEYTKVVRRKREHVIETSMVVLGRVTMYYKKGRVAVTEICHLRRVCGLDWVVSRC